MKPAEIDEIRTEHRPVQVRPASQGLDVRCLSPEHPKGGLPWPCQSIRLVHHIDTVERRAGDASKRIMRDTGTLWVAQLVNEIPRIP